MTHLPMAGVRVVEAAQFTYTPAAGAVLADWGADVIKIEHHVDGRRPTRDAGRARELRGGVVQADHGASQPREAQHRARAARACRARRVPRPRAHLRRLRHQLPARRARAAQDRRRRRPCGQPAHHLRARQRLRRKGPRRGQGRLRLQRVLVEGRWWRGDHPTRGRRRARHAGTCIRRLDGRHDDRRWDRRRALRPRAHRRRVRGRRVVARARGLGRRAGRRHRVALG